MQMDWACEGSREEEQKEAVLYALRIERESGRERAVIYSNNDVRLSQGRSRLIAYVVD